jgi:hypothetical protein
MRIMGTRRDVLGTIGAGLVTSAIGMPAWAQGKRKLGYAIVGLGSYATNQIMPRLKDCEFVKLKPLWSAAPPRSLRRFGTEYGVPKTHRYSYADYDSIRDNPDIDLVYVVLPNSHACGVFDPRQPGWQACAVRKADGSLIGRMRGNDRGGEEGEAQEIDDRLSLALRDRTTAAGVELVKSRLSSAGHG